MGEDTAAVYQQFLAADSPSELLDVVASALSALAPHQGPTVDREEFTVAADMGAPDAPGRVCMELQVCGRVCPSQGKGGGVGALCRTC